MKCVLTCDRLMSLGAHRIRYTASTGTATMGAPAMHQPTAFAQSGYTYSPTVRGRYCTQLNNNRNWKFKFIGFWNNKCFQSCLSVCLLGGRGGSTCNHYLWCHRSVTDTCEHPRSVQPCSLGTPNLSKLVYCVAHTSIGKQANGLWLKGLFVSWYGCDVYCLLSQQ